MGRDAKVASSFVPEDGEMMDETVEEEEEERALAFQMKMGSSDNAERRLSGVGGVVDDDDVWSRDK